MQLRVTSLTRIAVALIGLVLLVPGAPPVLADPGTLWVNGAHGPYLPPGDSCDNPGYATIQSAVNAAGSGTRVNVCPATYVEQVNVPAGKDNLTLRSTSLWQASIKAPADNPLDLVKAIVRVQGAHNTTILGFTITGPGSGGCNSLRYGVRVDSAGSANIYGNHITDIRDLPAPPNVSGCQNGVAILVGRAAEMTTGSANIFGNVIERYQKNGPTVSNNGSSAQIVANRILGVGPTATIAQNGIQVSSGATARLQYNFVANHIYTPQTVSSTGILLFSAGTVNVSRNTTPHDDDGIYAVASTATSTISQNRVSTSSFDGIVIDTINNHTVTDNDTEQNTGPGIGVYNGSQSNTITNNESERNKDSGILLDSASNNSVRGNHVRSNGTPGKEATAGDGMRANAGATNNTIQSNFMKNNVDFDCHDGSSGTGTAGTANFWINDMGDTQNRPGLCQPSRDSDDQADRTQTMQVQMASGWDPAYPWYTTTGDPITTEFDWATAYTTVDTQSVLQLLPQLQVMATRPAANPSVD